MKIKKISSKEKKIIKKMEVKIMRTMPIMENIEWERTQYVNGMEEYLQNLKKMDINEARKLAHKNLVNSGIIQENGEFTDRYRYSRQVLKDKR